MNDKFTEEELPRGAVMIVGRTNDGIEQAVVIQPDRPEIWCPIIEILLKRIREQPRSGYGAPTRCEEPQIT
jgi:hypothetical protein